MNNDLQFIETVCTNCGHEATQEVGWLKARAGRSDLICSECKAPIQYESAEIDFILRKNLEDLHYKLRLKKPGI